MWEFESPPAHHHRGERNDDQTHAGKRPQQEMIDMKWTRAFRRHQATRHMRRRLKEDRNQHYNDLTCPCWSDGKAMARFKEQPKTCSSWFCCGNPRRTPGRVVLTMQDYW